MPLGIVYYSTLGTVVAVVLVALETWRIGPLDKRFPTKRYHAARVGGDGSWRNFCFSATANVLWFATPLGNQGIKDRLSCQAQGR